MIPILFHADADPVALLDVNSVPLFDVNGVQLLAYPPQNSAREFDSYGKGALVDCIKCEVTEERNGAYELEMEYPITGAHFDDIELRDIIWAKPNYADAPQAFRIYFMSTPIEGVVTITARHLIYDLSGIPVVPFTATSASAACAGLLSHALVESPFQIGTQIGTIADFKVDVPSSVRSWFGGKEGSLIDVYGGEWAYDNYTATLKAARGQDRGVVIRYGKNLIDFEQENNCEEVYTGVLAYWADDEGHQVRTNIINVAGDYSFRRILVLDLSAEYEEQPTKAQLTARAQTYIEANNIGVPKVNITLDWVQTSELDDRVDLCDTVLVKFELIGVSAKAKCISTTWDVLKDRYSRIEFGDPKTNITDTIAGMQEAEKKQETSVSNAMLRAIANATALITGNSGGYVILQDGDGDGYPDELLVMNTPDVDTATSVWRFNKSGLGFSGSGYGGPYSLAMTANGEIVANFITTGELSADRINGGTITGVAINNGSGTFSVDENGNVTAASVAITGGYLDLDTESVAQGIRLKNTAGTTYTQHSAATRRRYVNNALVLGEVNGAITCVSVTQTSDGRLKEILPESIPDLSKVKAVRFRWKDGRDDREHIGYIAQDVEEIAPEMVTEEEGTKALDYIQVLVAKVERLEKENDELRERLDRLEARL